MLTVPHVIADAHCITIGSLHLHIAALLQHATWQHCICHMSLRMLIATSLDHCACTLQHCCSMLHCSIASATCRCVCLLRRLWIAVHAQCSIVAALHLPHVTADANCITIGSLRLHVAALLQHATRQHCCSIALATCLCVRILRRYWIAALAHCSIASATCHCVS
jgi:hypothetical protein